MFVLRNAILCVHFPPSSSTHIFRLRNWNYVGIFDVPACKSKIYKLWTRALTSFHFLLIVSIYILRPTHNIFVSILIYFKYIDADVKEKTTKWTKFPCECISIEYVCVYVFVRTQISVQWKSIYVFDLKISERERAPAVWKYKHTYSYRVAPFLNSFWLQHASYRLFISLFFFVSFHFIFSHFSERNSYNDITLIRTHMLDLFVFIVFLSLDYIRHKYSKKNEHTYTTTEHTTHTFSFSFSSQEIKCNFSHAFLTIFFSFFFFFFLKNKKRI